MKIPLGSEVKDAVSGFEGVATARVEYLNGCVHIAVTPKVHEGKLPPVEFFDEGQLTITGTAVREALETMKSAEVPGGPRMRDTPRL